ncbi:MAK10-like protein [Tanacetum coccineum]|uniref:MAK10-like protein n=1 Tax=Tanacetum coccineum TaxID=301880 RepID=A0ABQ4X2J5_9ASTR
MGDVNPIRTLGDYSRPSHEGYRNTIELPEGNNVDPNQHLKDFLKLVDSLDLDVANRERTRLRLFQFSLRDQASNCLERLPAGSNSTWMDLTTRFLAQFFPPGRTAKLYGVGARTPYYARKDFLHCHLPGEWEIARDAEINPFKDVLVFRRMVELLGAIPINLKRNMWESKDLVKTLIKWAKPPKNRYGAWHAKIRLIDPDGEEFTITLQSVPTSYKLSEREDPREIIDLGHFYDT